MTTRILGMFWQHRWLGACAVVLTGLAVVGAVEVVCFWDGREAVAAMEPAALLLPLPLAGLADEGWNFCTLPAQDLERRRALYERDVMPHVVSVHREPGALRLTLDTPAPATETIAVRMAELEKKCCALLKVRYAPEHGPAVIELGAPDAHLDQIAGWGPTRG